MCRLCFAAMSEMRNELFEKAGEALAKAGAVPTNTQRPPRKRRGYSLPQQPPSKCLFSEDGGPSPAVVVSSRYSYVSLISMV